MQQQLERPPAMAVATVLSARRERDGMSKR